MRKYRITLRDKHVKHYTAGTNQQPSRLQRTCHESGYSHDAWQPSGVEKLRHSSSASHDTCTCTIELGSLEALRRFSSFLSSAICVANNGTGHHAGMTNLGGQSLPSKSGVYWERVCSSVSLNMSKWPLLQESRYEQSRWSGRRADHVFEAKYMILMICTSSIEFCTWITSAIGIEEAYSASLREQRLEHVARGTSVPLP